MSIELRDLQTEFGKAIRSNESTSLPLEDHIEAKPNLTAADCVNIYRRLYRVRMDEALGIDFAICKDVLGPQKFRDLCSAYEEEYPSQTWTLNEYGKFFPKFIKEHIAKDSDLIGLQSLAEFEWALIECSVAPSAISSAAKLSEMNATDQLRVCFATAPSTRFLELDFSISRILKKFASGNSSFQEMIPPESESILVFRRLKKAKAHFQVLNFDESYLVKKLLQNNTLEVSLGAIEELGRDAEQMKLLLVALSGWIRESVLVAK